MVECTAWMRIRVTSCTISNQSRSSTLNFVIRCVKDSRGSIMYIEIFKSFRTITNNHSTDICILATRCAIDDDLGENAEVYKSHLCPLFAEIEVFFRPSSS